MGIIFFKIKRYKENMFIAPDIGMWGCDAWQCAGILQTRRGIIEGLTISLKKLI